MGLSRRGGRKIGADNIVKQYACSFQDHKDISRYELGAVVCLLSHLNSTRECWEGIDACASLRRCVVQRGF